MPGLFDNQAIDIPCPKCSKKHSKTVGWLKSNRQISCSCGVEFRLDPHKLLGVFKKAERDLAQMPGKITIKL